MPACTSYLITAIILALPGQQVSTATGLSITDAFYDKNALIYVLGRGHLSLLPPPLLNFGTPLV